MNSNLKQKFGALILGVVLMIAASTPRSAHAKRAAAKSVSGSGAIGFGFTAVNATQGDINSVIAAEAATSSISTKEITSAYEFWAQYVFQFDGTMFAIALRPSYFTAGQSGSGTGGSFDYKLTGYTLFPLIRLYPLENGFMRLFMQAGLGWGKLSTSITQGADTLAFEGSNYGAMGGLGVDFCFTESHCVTIEGDIRYLPIERNLATSASSSSMGGFTQTQKDKEVEINNRDLDTTMSGVMGTIAYTYYF